MKEITKALIIANLKKSNVIPIVQMVQQELENRGIKIFHLSPSYFKLRNNDIISDFDNKYKHSDFDIILAIGGDGTFLYTARTFVDFNIPIVGINAGRVGFLMEVLPNEISEAIDKICQEKVLLEKRILLEVIVSRGGKKIFQVPFLNDAVISKGSFSRMIEIFISLDKEALSQYRADGLIVSTPTGSTAYNLAAGGPIMTPDMDAMIITPICPHTLGVRPIVTGCDKKLEIRMVSGEENTNLTVDGQENFYLEMNDIIEIHRLDKTIQIFDYGEKQFFSVLREKLGWHI